MVEKKLHNALQGLQGEIEVPGDKSISHRAIMLGALAEGQTTIKNFSNGQDCLTTMTTFRKLGVKIDFKQADKEVNIIGRGFTGLKEPANTLDMGNSGTTTRLLLGILAASQIKAKLSGDQSLNKRPMARVQQPLAQLGAQIEISPTKTLPAQVKPSKLTGTTIKLDVASAQVKSAVILAALKADGKTTVIEKLPTRNHTEIMLRQFGGQVETLADGRTIKVTPVDKLIGSEVMVPGDISSAAFFMVAAAITPNSKVTVKNVSLNPTRTGIIDILKKMQANLTIIPTKTAGEPLGDVTVVTSELVPIKLTAADIPAVIDELPLVALLAANANGISEISGAKELRFKETDRIKTVSQELRKLNVAITEREDGMIIDGHGRLKVTAEVVWDSHGDHRLGMLGAVAALNSSKKFKLKGAEAVAISYPSFFTDLSQLIVGGLDD